MATITINIRSGTSIQNSLSFKTEGSASSIIQAQKGVQYELIDQATGIAPKHIVIQRSGDDLHIAFENNDISEPDLIIRDYYNDAIYSQDSAIIGLAEDGNFYPFIPDSGQMIDSVSQLAQQVAQGQHLEASKGVVAWNFQPAWAAIPLLLLGGIGLSKNSHTTLNDKNHNGMDDEQEAKFTNNAEELVRKAELLEKEAETLAKAVEDKIKRGDLVTQAEIDAIKAKNSAVLIAKDKAQHAVSALPENATNGATPEATKSSLQNRVDEIFPANIPTLNDKNNNGMADDEEAAKIGEAADLVKQAEALEKEAEGLSQAAQDKLDRNEPLSQTEVDAIKAKNQEVLTAKDKAQEAVSALPENASNGAQPPVTKDGLQTRVNEINPADVPEANDKDNDGIIDSTADAVNAADALVKQAEALEKEAEDLSQAAQDKLDRNEPLSQAEVDAIKAKNAEVSAAKDKAQEAVSALPENASNGAQPPVTKDGLQTRVNEINPADVPEANDKDNDGIIDTTQSNIEALVKAAEVANQKVVEASNKNNVDTNGDGKISKQEYAAAQQKVTEANAPALKQTAADEVAKLADSTGKRDFEARLDALQGARLPEVDRLSAPTGKDQLVEAHEDTAKTFSANDFSKGFADQDGNSFAGIVLGDLTSHGSLTLNGVPVRTGQEIAASDLGRLQFQGAKDFSGQDSFTFFVKDNGNVADFADGSANKATGANTMNINVMPVMDTLNFNAAPQSIAEPAPAISTGLWKTAFQITANGTDPRENIKIDALKSTLNDLIKSNQAELVNTSINAIGKQTFGYEPISPDPNDISLKKTGNNDRVERMRDQNDPDGIKPGQGEKISGLIYLQAGSKIKFNYFADDYIRIDLGGKHVLTDSSGWTADVAHGVTITESGYYTLDIYAYNVTNGNKGGQVGALALTMSTDGGKSYKQINGTNFKIYKNAAEAFSQEVNLNAELKQIDGSAGSGGYYTANKLTNHGYAGDTQTKISFTETSADADGSEQIESMTLSFDKTVKAGTTLTDDAEHSYTFKGITGETVDITGWNTAKLQFNGGLDAGIYKGTVTTTWKDSATIGTWDSNNHVLTGSSEATVGKESVHTVTVKIHNHVIDLSAGNQILQLSASDLIDAGNNTHQWYITGDRGDIVDLGRNGTGLNDGSATWTKGAEHRDYNGITYNTYTISTSEETLYIQTGINVI